MAEARYFLRPHPDFVADLQRLADVAQSRPRSPEENLARVTLTTLADLRTGAERGTHSLGYMSSYADLSDCETTYIGADPTKRTTHRLVWRNTTETHNGLPVREVLGLGVRDGGQIYHEIGKRLGREPGVRLTNLPTAEQLTRDTIRRLRATGRTNRDRAITQDQNQVWGRGQEPHEPDL